MVLQNKVRGQALVMAFSDVFLILAVLFTAVVLLVPLARKPRADAAAAGGTDPARRYSLRRKARIRSNRMASRMATPMKVPCQ